MMGKILKLDLNTLPKSSCFLMPLLLRCWVPSVGLGVLLSRRFYRRVIIGVTLRPDGKELSKEEFSQPDCCNLFVLEGVSSTLNMLP